MTDLGVVWQALWDAIEVEVKKVTEFTVRDEIRVYMTIKWPPNKFPSAFIQPSVVSMTASSTTEDYYDFTFVVYIFAKAPDPEDHMKECMTLAGKVRAQLIDDRRLGGAADNVEVLRFEINPPGTPRGFERQCIGVVVVTHYQVD